MVTWAKVFTGPKALRVFMNVWPPFRAAGIRVESIQEDYCLVRVALRSTILNRNYVGTHFGGSLFAMTDPFFMLMMMRNLGDNYYVWDLSGEIDFVSPGKGRVSAELVLTEADIAETRQATATGDKFEKEFKTSIYDAKGELVARVRKRLYIRLKPAFRPERKTQSEG